MSSQAAVSSPGKVLVAGGYLVVDREYTGLAFALSARIHVHVQPLPEKTGPQIVVKSPQFSSAEWVYDYSVGGVKDSNVSVEQNESTLSPRNKFVETVLRFALTYISTLSPTSKITPSLITILADTAYYSHADTATANPSASSASPFLNFNVSLNNAHKTGLGSSAALVTSLASAILTYYLASSPSSFDVSGPVGRKRAHNLAQLAHCSAQGKVGSGFDVAAAVYGSCLYRRFSPSVLEGLGQASSDGFGKRLVELVNDDGGHLWDTEVQSSDSARMAAGLGLFMCDVDCGSETPGMVKQIFAWRKDDRENADRIWKELQAKNEMLAKALLDADDDKGNYAQKKQLIRDVLQDCRRYIREMSERSGVPVEPPAQTELLDACSSFPGVLGGVVPGAGGYDAVVLVAEDTEKVRNDLRKFLIGYKSKLQGDGPQIGKVSLLDVKQEMQGVRIEDPSVYAGWI